MLSRGCLTPSIVVKPLRPFEDVGQASPSLFIAGRLRRPPEMVHSRCGREGLAAQEDQCLIGRCIPFDGTMVTSRFRVRGSAAPQSPSRAPFRLGRAARRCITPNFPQST